MFYQIQFYDVQQQINRRIASMQSDLIKYAADPKANPKAIQAKEGIVTQLHDYAEYVNNLFLELREANASAYADGFKAGTQKTRLEYEPEQRRRSNNKELDRFNSITRARQLWPELY